MLFEGRWCNSVGTALATNVCVLLEQVLLLWSPDFPSPPVRPLKIFTQSTRNRSGELHAAQVVLGKDGDLGPRKTAEKERGKGLFGDFNSTTYPKSFWI